jgi:pimeloyl-ACP methyl ester carboxylesterase
MVTHHSVSLPDGRSLHVHEAGDPSGPVVVYHHGTPSCGHLLEIWCQDAEERGIRLLGIDRSGYGESDPQPGRGLADVVADTLAVADWAGAERFRTWGVSGGGPHALACAALAPERVIAVASVAGVVPWDVDGFDYLEGMGEENHVEFGKAVVGGDELRDYLEEQRAAILGGGPDAAGEALETLLCDADREFLATPAGAEVDGTMASGLRHRVDGWYDDDRAFVQPWPFDVADLRVPVLVCHGTEDAFVPVDHGHWLSSHIPDCEALIRVGEGHLSLYGRVSEVHEWLLEH